MLGSKLLSLILATLIIMSLLTTTIKVGSDQPLGPAFNTVVKTPLIKPKRGITPANYTHYLTFYYLLNETYLRGYYNKREGFIQTFYIGNDTVRVIGINRWNQSEVFLTDFNMVSLNYTMKYRLVHYFDTPCISNPCVWIGGVKHSALRYSDYNIVYTGNWNGSTVLVSFMKTAFTPIITIKHGARKVVSNMGQVLVTILNDTITKEYVFDFGSLIKREYLPREYDLPITMYSGITRPFHILSTNIVNGKLLVAESSIGWPGVFVNYFRKQYFDYVNMNTTILDKNYTLLKNVGVVLARIDLENVTNTKAVFIYSKGYNVSSKAIPTSDGGFLVLLMSVDRVLFAKIGSSFNIEWSTALVSNESLFKLPKTEHYLNYYIVFSKLLETSNGYAALLPYNDLPLVVYLDREGKVKWVARLNATNAKFMAFTEFSYSKGYIYLSWYYTNVPGGMPRSWITIFTEEGKVLGSYHNGVRFYYNIGLFADVRGKLGETITYLTRPHGYYPATNRPDGYIDAGYLTKDYLTAELGGSDPFREWSSNSEDLEKGRGWIVYKNEDLPENLTISYDVVLKIAEYKHPLIFSDENWGYENTNMSLSINATPIHTLLLNKSKVEFRYSFVYPVAILPKEVNFGEIHVGETKAVDMEIIWLVRSEVSGSIAYHRVDAEDRSFSFGNVTIPCMIHGDIGRVLYYLFHTENNTYGLKIRFRLIFSPKTPGIHTSTFGIGSAPKGIYVWSPVSWDYPRQIIPIRGVAVPENESISTDIYPIEIGVSAITSSVPGSVVVGSAYRETFYITNIGTSEMVFVYIGWALPGNTILKLEGTDMILGMYPNETNSAYLVSFTLRIKPMETRRVDVYMRLTREIADTNSIYHILALQNWPQGMIIGEAAALPPGEWLLLLKNNTGENTQSLITKAMNISREYIDAQLYRLFNYGSEEEVVDILYRMRLNNPDLYNYIFYLIERKTAMRDEWFFSQKYSVKINVSNVINKKIRIPLYYLVRSSNGTLQYIGSEQKQDIIDKYSSRLSDLPLQQYHSALQYCMANPLVCMGEFFKPKEFLETSAQGVIGLGKGLVNAFTLGFVDLKADNEYQLSGKIGGIIIGNIIMSIGEAKLIQYAGRGIEAIGTYTAEKLALAFKNWARTRRIVPAIDLSRDSMHLYAVQKIGGKYPIRFGIEAVNWVGGEIRKGTIVKWALNKAFEEQGWYLGIGYVRTFPAKIGSKLIYKTYFHFYPRIWKAAVWYKPLNIYVDVYMMDDYIIPAIKSLGNWMSFLEISKSIIEYNGLDYAVPSFSADPNHLTLNPSGYVNKLSSNISATIHFENLKNATAPAHNITVKLYIKGKVNPNTVIIWNTDHPEAFKNYTVEYNDTYTVVTVRFVNINLPPNKDPPEGEGSVTILFSPAKNLVSGDIIEAFADVYFDYNKPVRTNTEKIIYDKEPPNIDIETNITKEKVSIKIIGTDKVSGIKESTIAVFDEYGRLVKSDTIELGKTITYNLASGKFYVKAYVIDNAGNEAIIKKEIKITGITIMTKTTTSSKTTITSPARTTSTTQLVQTSKTIEKSKRFTLLYVLPVIIVTIAVAVYLLYKHRCKSH